MFFSCSCKCFDLFKIGLVSTQGYLKGFDSCFVSAGFGFARVEQLRLLRNVAVIRPMG